MIYEEPQEEGERESYARHSLLLLGLSHLNQEGRAWYLLSADLDVHSVLAGHHGLVSVEIELLVI